VGNKELADAFRRGTGGEWPPQKWGVKGDLLGKRGEGGQVIIRKGPTKDRSMGRRIGTPCSCPPKRTAKKKRYE